MNLFALSESMDNDRKQARWYILNYEEARRNYEQSKAEALSPQNPANQNAGGHGGSVSSPTELKALRSITYDREHKEYFWLKAVEILQRTLSPQRVLFLKVRRQAELNRGTTAGRPAWIAYTQTHYMCEPEKTFIQGEAQISERRIKAMWADMVNKAVEIYLRIKK